MREILFRGKRKDNGEWVEGDLVHSKTTSRGVIVEIYTLEFMYEVNPETLGQFTGLLDKNGKRIFCWDIIRAHSNSTEKSRIYKVQFSGGRLWFGFGENTHGYTFSLDELLEKEVGDELEFEVIGNIYDNPEFLEVNNG